MDQQAVAVARQFLDVRAARARHFSHALFDEHAWDILLHLLVARADGRAVALADLPDLIGAPGAVADRWVDALAADGLVQRVADSDDTRLALTDDGADRLIQALRTGAAPPA